VVKKQPGAPVATPTPPITEQGFMVCYSITQVRTTSFTILNSAGLFGLTQVEEIHNQFGDQLLTVRRAESLCVPSIKSVPPTPTSTATATATLTPTPD
jgi:hypothetical protein